MGLRRMADGISRFLKNVVRITGLNRANQLSCGLSELFEPVYLIRKDGRKYFFYCPNNKTLWRARTYFTKEPETIEWIDTFKEGDTLFDIGANVGLYSIYAAKKKVKVVAFEPESQNFAALNKNVYLNDCQNEIMCLNVALTDHDSVDYLNIPVFQTGGAINCFGRATDEYSEAFTPAFKQGIISYSLDSFLEKYPNFFPSHIKIDVDGLEPEIVRGGVKTLGHSALRSIAIEVNDDLKEHRDLVEIIKSKGFSLVWKRHAPVCDKGKHRNFFNYLFRR